MWRVIKLIFSDNNMVIDGKVLEPTPTFFNSIVGKYSIESGLEISIIWLSSDSFSYKISIEGIFLTIH